MKYLVCSRCHYPCRVLLADSLSGPWDKCVRCWYVDNDASRREG